MFGKSRITTESMGKWCNQFCLWADNTWVVLLCLPLGYGNPEGGCRSYLCGNDGGEVSREKLDNMIRHATTNYSITSVLITFSVVRPNLTLHFIVYKHQVDHTKGAASFETKTQPYPRIITMYSEHWELIEVSTDSIVQV